MPISLTWLDDTRSELLSTFDGSWTWDDFHQTLDESARLFPQGSSSVSSLIDFSRSRGLPPGSPLAHARRAFKLYDEQPNFSGFVVAITTRPFTVMLCRVLATTRIAPGLLVASTYDEALELLRAKKAQKSV